MDKLKLSLILFILIFIIVFLVDYLFIKRKYLKRINGKGKRKKKKNNELIELSYLVGKFNLDKNKLPLKKVLMISSIINALIISLVSIVVMLIKVNYIIQLMIGFVLLISLIYSLYEIYGRFLVKKGYGKNGK